LAVQFKITSFKFQLPLSSARTLFAVRNAHIQVVVVVVVVLVVVVEAEVEVEVEVEVMPATVQAPQDFRFLAVS
jgi:hypothetical protein